MIDGKEFLLAGRTNSKESAKSEKAALLKSHAIVRIIKLNDWDFMIYIHG